MLRPFVFKRLKKQELFHFKNSFKEFFSRRKKTVFS